MNETYPKVRPLLRWLGIAGLLLFLTLVFSFQLYVAGYVTPWSRAFLQESVYWASCGTLALPISWMCRRLHRGAHGWAVYAFALALAGVVAMMLQPAVALCIACAASGRVRSLLP